MKLKKSISLLIGILLVLILAATDGYAMRKPVDVRDYNGTFSGAPGTGTYGYTTLWRDNYSGTTSGCEGEGCGKHPGVDIPVPSGTNVYAAIGGTVVRSIDNCTSTGWGGLIIIQSASPYTGETIYTTYAHLRKRYASSGSVAEGTLIGESGGSTGDYCHGNSSGSHLHFQIDKNDGNYDPWYPTNRVNQSDSDFEVARYTYNPIVFVTSRYNWTFDEAGNSEYWQPRNVSSWGVSSSVLWIDGNNDPGIQRSDNINCGHTYNCSGQIAAESNLYQNIYITMYNYCLWNPAKIYWTTSVNDNWDETKSVSFYYSGAGTYRVYMGNNYAWAGIIKRIRIDPAINCNPYSTDPSYFYQITVGR